MFEVMIVYHKLFRLKTLYYFLILCVWKRTMILNQYVCNNNIYFIEYKTYLRWVVLDTNYNEELKLESSTFIIMMMTSVRAMSKWKLKLRIVTLFLLPNIRYLPKYFTFVDCFVLFLVLYSLPQIFTYY